jgi:hypothetical protein
MSTRLVTVIAPTGPISEQPALLLGAEVIVIGSVMVVAPIVFQARAWSVRKDAWERIMRAVSTTGFSWAFVGGGAFLLEGARSSPYWIAAGDILGIIAVVLSAWVLMVEILR